MNKIRSKQPQNKVNCRNTQGSKLQTKNPKADTRKNKSHP